MNTEENVKLTPELLAQLKREFAEEQERIEKMTPAERAEYDVKIIDDQVARQNAEEAPLEEIETLNCPICHNKRFIAYRDKETNMIFTRSCSCVERVRNYKNLQESGLLNTIKTMTFENYQTKENWQIILKQKAEDFTNEAIAGGKKWFTILGQSGCGKTHLCTAICGKLIGNGKQLRYFRWLDEGKTLKRLASDPEYDAQIEPFKCCEFLYIDDLFKRKSGEKVTDADVKLAFEIINYRIDAGLVTLISGEDTFVDLIGIDEALAGRIKMQSGEYLIRIEKNQDKNFRLK